MNLLKCTYTKIDICTDLKKKKKMEVKCVKWYWIINLVTRPLKILITFYNGVIKWDQEIGKYTHFDSKNEF